MKYRRILAAALVVLVLGLAGCDLGLGGVAKKADPAPEAAKNVTIAVQGINPIMKAVFGKAKTGSRGFMFLTSVYISVYDTNWNNVYANNFEATPNGPQDFQGSIKIPLNAGQNYYIYAYTKNANESDPNAYYQCYAYKNVTINQFGDTWVQLDLLPYYSYPIESGMSATQSIKACVVTGSGEDAIFTTIGGEKWFSYNTAAGETTAKFSISPPAGSYVYAAIFDSYGKFLNAGVSPNFPGMGGGATNVVELEVGVTAYSTVYVGVITVADVSTDQSVTVTNMTPTIVDDVFEDNDSWDSARDIELGTPYELMAWDSDYFRVFLEEDGALEFSLTAPLVPVSGDFRLLDEFGNIMNSWWMEDTMAFLTTSQELPAGTYRIATRVTARSPMGFQVSAGPYTLQINSGSALVNAITNGNFDDDTYSDIGWWYYSTYDLATYVNNPSYDNLPGWTYYWGGNNGPIDVGVYSEGNDWQINGYAAHLSTPDSYGNYSGWGMTMTANDVAPTTIGPDSVLKLKFKSQGFNGGGAEYPYYEGPVRVWVNVGMEDWRLLKVYNPNGAEGWDCAAYIGSNAWVTDEITLQDHATLMWNGSAYGEGIPITGGDTITGVRIECNGWYWDVLVDSVELYQ